MVGLLARATLESSRHDCRFGIYRMSARNYQYLDAVLTGLSAGRLAGVAEGLKATRGQRNEIARLALYSLAFAGNAPDALELGQQLLASPEPGVQDRIWIRLALAEAAREAWRAEVLDAQLAALQPQALAGLAGFLVFSLQAERRAQLQTFPWEQALSDYRKARARLEAAGPDQKWPVGSGHFLAQAQCAWSEILTQSAQTPEQQTEAEKCLEELRGRFSQSSNPEVLQAVLFAHLERLSQERALEKWERCLTDLNAIQSALERLASLSEQASKAEKEDFSQRASQIKKLALSHKELSDSGLHLMADNLAPGDPAVGELARLECTYYRESSAIGVSGCGLGARSGWPNSVGLAVSENVVEFLIGLVIHGQLFDLSVGHVVDPTVHDRQSTFVLDPGFLYNRGLANVVDLLNDVEFDHSSLAGLGVGYGVQFLVMKSVDIFDVAQPVVENAVVAVGHSGFDATALVVAANDDVLDLEVIDRIVQYAEHRHVGMVHQVGYVSSGEDFARARGGDLVIGHPAVGASDPEIVRLLALGQLGEEFGVVVFLAGNVDAVALEESLIRI